MNKPVLATTMRVAYSFRKISDVANKPAIFEQTPVEPKKKFISFKSFKSLPEKFALSTAKKVADNTNKHRNVGT